MKDMHFHLPNEGLEGVEGFALVFFYAHINTAFCFLHIWSIASGQLLSNILF